MCDNSAEVRRVNLVFKGPNRYKFLNVLVGSNKVNKVVKHDSCEGQQFSVSNCSDQDCFGLFPVSPIYCFLLDGLDSLQLLPIS